MARSGRDALLLAEIENTAFSQYDPRVQITAVGKLPIAVGM